MIEKELEQLLIEKGKARFKFLSLEYTIEFINNEYVIYADYYKENKKSYNSLKELLSNYLVYNESLKSNMDKINILDSQ